jgi:hypothetical protein
LLPASGCGRKILPLPDTYPVSGKVVFSDGKPAPGGAVTFQSQADTTVSSNGIINSDGTFTISCFRDNQKKPGTIAGPHRVMVTGPIDEKRGMLFPVKIFTEPYVVKPGDNQFTLIVEK